ncbi:MAG: two-component regulator propeller domain-containing protein [Phycisphaerales bacterium]
MRNREFDSSADTTHRSQLLAVVCGAVVAFSGGCCSPPTPTGPPPSGSVVFALDSHIASVVQGKDGSYWFASRENGLFHYNGTRIVRYTTDDGLAGNHIAGVQQDPAGNLVVVSGENAFRRFDGARFQPVDVKTDTDATWRLDANDLWFSGGSNVPGVYRFDGNVVHFLTFPTTKAGDEHYAEVPRDKFPNARYSPYDVFTIMKDSRGHLWFGTSLLGVCRYDGTTLAWGPAWNNSFGVRGVVEDKDGKFWFTATGRRHDVSLKAGPGTPGAAPAPAGAPAVGALVMTTEPGLGSNDPIGAFVSAHRDKRGDLWFATLGDGVYRYNGTTTTHYPVLDEKGAPVWIYSMYMDANEILWVCTQGAGVHRFNGRAFERFSP